MSETTTISPPEGYVPTEPAVTVPEGFVPVAEVEAAREEARRRYQGEKDRLEAELARMKAESATPAAPAASAGQPKGFDPEAYRAALLRDVSATLSLTTAAQQLRAEFPHADPALFTPDGLTQFSTPDALRFAVQDSHARVAAILEAERSKIREELVAEVAQRYGSGGGAAGATGGPAGIPGDPTPQQLAAMPLDEFNAVDPEVVARVLRGAS